MSDLVVFGRYQIIRRVATGGMGEIFLARQRGVAGFDRLAILKSLLPDLAEDEASLAAFLDEARVAANLNHPNVVAVYEVDQWEGVYFIAMEYIAGVDLSRLAKMTRSQGVAIPPALLALVFRDACRGLGYAHTAVDANGAPINLVHRDATPHNIMLRRDGSAKVVDFGVAKAANRAVRTSTGVLKGKLQYMPPEQVRGEEVTARSDQWSLGASLWEMLAGRRMIMATEPMDIFRAVLSGKFPPPSSVVEGIPPTLDRIVARMIAADPAARFASCVEAADQLDDFVRSEGMKQGQVAEFVARVAGATIDAVTADLTPQPVSIPGRRAPVPAASAPSPPSPPSPPAAASALAEAVDTPTQIVPTQSRARFCSHCGAALPAESRFCMSCGTPIVAGPAPAPASSTSSGAPEPPSPPSTGSSTGSMTPPAVSLLTPSASARGASRPPSRTPGGQRGAPPLPSASGPAIDVAQLGLAAADDLMRAVAAEKRTVCVGRATVAGTLAPADQPELVLQRAAALDAAIARAVADGGGITESSAVDSVLFTVGAEQTREDDPAVAIRIAFALDELVRRCAAAWGVNIGLRAAIDCGPAVVSDTTHGRRVTGVPKDRAQRIERRVGTPRVLVSVDVARLARRAWETAAPFTVKDDDLSFEVAQVTGPARIVQRGPLFVGRRRELDELRQALTTRPSRVAVVGAAGTGRTAFLDEVFRQASAARVPVLRARTRGEAGPYAVARTLVVGDGDDARTRLEQLALPAPTLQRLRRVFFGVGAAPRAAEAADAMILDESVVVDALELAAGGASGGGVLLVDDWGRVDSASRAALARVGARTAPVTLVFAALPEDPLPEGVRRLVLDPLDSASLRAVVAHELGVEEVPAPLASYIDLHAQGSPSLARLIVEDLVDQQLVTVHGGRAGIAAALATTPAPASLLRVYEARFDRVTDETRALLRAAAVLGDEFAVDLAGAMIGIDGQLRAGALLGPALQAGLIQTTSPTTYAFRPGLRTSVLARTLQGALTSLHRRALELLEARATDDNVAVLEAMARHAEAANDDARFIVVACRAARALETRGGRADAVAWFRRALEVAERVARRTSSRDDVEAVVEIAIDVLTAGLAVEAAAVIELWKRHAEPFVALVPTEVRAWGLRAYGRALVAAGRAKDAVEVFDRALDAVPETDDDTRALFLSDLGGALEANGDVSGAVVQLVEAFRRVQGRQNRHAEFAFEALNRLGRLYLRNKSTAKARDTFRLAQAQAAAVGDESGVSRSEMNLGTCAALDGDSTLAQQLFRASAERAAAVGDVTQSARARLNLGRLLASTQPAQAREVLTEALTDAERVGWKEGVALARHALTAFRG
jgi:serine/threonine protein kinase/tetratricopeptide (TPR) repeat protein